MPFTLAHPGAVILIKNKHVSLSGLVLGAMAPDFMYFILFSPSNNFGHTLLGAVVLNMPLCFLLNELYYKVLRNAFIINLPEGLFRLYAHGMGKSNPVTSLKTAFVFAYSSLLGMFTHVFWDAFTHNTGYFVTRLDFLMDSVNVLDHQVYVYKICQHGSTLVGFAIIGMFLYSLKGKYEEGFENSNFPYHTLAWLIGLIVLSASYLIFKGNFPIGRGVVSGINGLFIGYLLSSIIFNITNQHHIQ